MPLAAAVLALAAVAAPPSAGALRAQVATRGAAAVVSELYRAGRWEGVLGRIGRGDGPWIATAPVLAPGTVAATAETLSIALAEALPRNPRAVLAVLDLGGPGVLSPTAVCSAPFIEPPPGRLAAYRRAARRAVSGVVAPSLAPVRSACLAALRAP